MCGWHRREHRFGGAYETRSACWRRASSGGKPRGQAPGAVRPRTVSLPSSRATAWPLIPIALAAYRGRGRARAEDGWTALRFAGAHLTLAAHAEDGNGWNEPMESAHTGTDSTGSRLLSSHRSLSTFRRVLRIVRQHGRTIAASAARPGRMVARRRRCRRGRCTHRAVRRWS